MSLDETQRPDVRLLPGNRPGVVILTVKGALTIGNFVEFQDAARRDSPITIVDLAGVPFLDSAALGCLLSIHDSCKRSGRKYALVNLPERLRTMFSVTGMADFLIIYSTVEDAENALAT
ncbi:MAG TPA: STAS domain-containing protein [Bryobacteraceae bacterium]|jgi:anti-anti-sigma factor|nr:STAS domain-containing protein [Bryobacteraceae bacterium]